MKQRYTSLDLRVIAHELSQTLISFRLSNIYDISSTTYQRIFVLKFALPNSKHLLLVDSGFRCHLTAFSRTTSTSPSSFVARLRKHLRTRRLTSVRQLGTDRVLEFTFSDGKYRLYLEFYAGGNVVLVNEESICIAVLRIVPAGEGGRRETKVGSPYAVPEGREGEQDVEEAPALPEEPEKKGKTKAGQGKKFKRKKGEDSLKRVLSSKIPEFSPALIEHALSIVGVDPELRAEDVLKDNTLIDKVLQAFAEAQKAIEEVTSKTGKLFEDEEPEENGPELKIDEDGFQYDDFHPFRPWQFVNAPGFKIIEVEGYNNTVDTFFSSIESQKLTTRLQDRKLAAVKKLTSARSEHQSRVNALQSVQTLNERKAQAIEANLDKVEEAIASVNSLLYQGVDWKGIDIMINNARMAGNPVAELVGGLKLTEGVITLLLAEEGAEGEEELDEESRDVSESEEESDDDKMASKKEKEQEKLRIDVKLVLSGWANAREYYSEKKTAAVKEERTMQASTKALKSAERKVLTDLKKGLNKEKQLLRPVRQQMWFEKFYFFISTDGYLVLGGRDPQQTELLYQRHFKPGDVLVSAEIEGAATLIVKNQNAHIPSLQTTTSHSPISPTTLAQAGTFSICTSKAWETKAVMSAWWVNWDQVSKTVKETGDYIGEVGRFVIAGSKNYLPPAQLGLGYAVLWVTGEANQGYLEGEQATVQLEQAGEEGPTEREGDDDERQPNEDENESEEEESDEEFPDVQIRSEGEDNDEDTKTDNEGEYTSEVNETETLISVGESVDVAKANFAEDEGNDESRVQSPGKKHLSAKERRELKKAKSTTSPSPSPSPAAGNVPKIALKTTTAPTPAQAPRGKKHTSKQKKKLAVKYALLSDDEREMARELLGTLSVDTAGRKALSKEAEKAVEELAQRQRKKEQQLRAQALGKVAEAKRFGWKLPSVTLVTPARPAQSSTREDLDKETEEADGEGEPTNDAQQEGPLDFTRLTGMPSSAAGIVDAIPVCAPYSALGKYKYKVKLLPAVGGASKDVQKKGKAVKDIVGGWIKVGEPLRPGTSGKGGAGGGIGKGRGVGMGFEGWDEQGVDVEKMWPREWELLKNWRAEEILNCVPVSRVRVVGIASGRKGEGGKGGNSTSKGKAGGGGGKGKSDGGGKAGKGGKRK
ncbi:fibronectin-binding protein A N-terminus-domain-containing protein [Terfezia claveryi]|nr:fibronectin-binding protein A N-terminus-domain-containing protein [Terfezia claveryi]